MSIRSHRGLIVDSSILQYRLVIFFTFHRSCAAKARLNFSPYVPCIGGICPVYIHEDPGAAPYKNILNTFVLICCAQRNKFGGAMPLGSLRNVQKYLLHVTIVLLVCYEDK